MEAGPALNQRRMGEENIEYPEKVNQDRRYLFDLTKQGASAWPAIQGKIREVSDLQVRLEEEVLRFSLAFQEHLKPEQRAAFIAFMERRMASAPGGKGRRPPGWERGKGARAPQADGPCGP